MLVFYVCSIIQKHVYKRRLCAVHVPRAAERLLQGARAEHLQRAHRAAAGTGRGYAGAAGAEGAPAAAVDVRDAVAGWACYTVDCVCFSFVSRTRKPTFASCK